MRKGSFGSNEAVSLIAVIIFAALALGLITGIIDPASPVFNSCNSLLNIISNAQGSTLC